MVLVPPVPTTLPTLPTTLPTQIPGVRRFGDAAIQAAIDRTLGEMPPEARVAVVAVADTSGARLAAVARVGEHWSAMGYLDREWSGELKAGAEVRWWI